MPLPRLPLTIASVWKCVAAAVDVDLDLGLAADDLRTQEAGTDQVEGIVTGEVLEHRRGQDDLVLRAAGDAEVGDGVDAVTKTVEAELIDAAAAGQVVAAGPANEKIIAVATFEHVDARTAEHPVVAAAAVELVVAVTGVEESLPSPPREHVVAGAAEQLVVAVAAFERIVVVAAVERVVAVAAAQDVIAGAA